MTYWGMPPICRAVECVGRVSGDTGGMSSPTLSRARRMTDVQSALIGPLLPSNEGRRNHTFAGDRWAMNGDRDASVVAAAARTPHAMNMPRPGRRLQYRITTICRQARVSLTSMTSAAR